MGEPVEAVDKGRGYEVDKGLCLRVEDEELDAIAIDSSHTFDIDCFIPKSEIDERYGGLWRPRLSCRCPRVYAALVEF